MSASGPTRRDRRRGKSDQLDAAAAARRLLAGDGLAKLRGFGPREQLRILLLERRSARTASLAALNQLHALVVTAPQPLRARLERLRGQPLARRAATLRTNESCVPAMRRLGRRALALAEEIEPRHGCDRRLPLPPLPVQARSMPRAAASSATG